MNNAEICLKAKQRLYLLLSVQLKNPGPLLCQGALERHKSEQFIDCRPLLGAPSNTSPGYGTTITIPFTFTGGPAVPITRVVVNRIGGITHSLHMDQRQVSAYYLCCCLLP